MAGISPCIFWGLTPWQLKCCIDAFALKKQQDHDESSWIMWHGAALGRVERMPPMSDFMSVKKEVKGIDENAILMKLRQYQAQQKKELPDGSGS